MVPWGFEAKRAGAAAEASFGRYIPEAMPFLALVGLLLQLQIPAPTGYVNDFAHVIDPASRARLEAIIDRVRAASGGEIVVITLPALGGREAIDVGRDIGRQWKVKR